MSKTVKSTTNTKKCRMCRAKFTPKTGGQKYCSSKCSDKAQRIQKNESAKRRYDRRKLAREQEQQQVTQPKPRFENFSLPDNGTGRFYNRQPDPYWGF